MSGNVILRGFERSPGSTSPAGHRSSSIMGMENDSPSGATPSGVRRLLGSCSSSIFPNRYGDDLSSARQALGADRQRWRGLSSRRDGSACFARGQGSRSEDAGTDDASPAREDLSLD